MLKDSNIDPTLMANDSDYLIGNNASMNTFPIKVSDSPGVASKPANTPRSTHKIVTPLRKQNTSFLVASLESLFSDSQGVSEQIAKISTNSSSFMSPATNLAGSFASMCSMDNLNLADPSLLQSHVQKSLESSSIGLESPYNSCNSNSNRSQSNVPTVATNSLYNTPLRCKQSRSYDLSELPSQQRISRRRSSILAQEDEDLLSILTATTNENDNDNKDNAQSDYNFLKLVDDLSNYKDNEDDSIMNVITNCTTINNNNTTNIMITNDSESESEDYNCFDEESKENSSNSNKKRPFSKTARSFNLPSPKDYLDGSKPPFSYASLIAQAIISSPKQRLALSNIYCWIMETYPYYKSQSCGWQNSIRHNLSLNKCFKKIPRDDDEPGKGAYWTVDLDEMDDFEDGMFKRRRNGSNGSNSNSHNISCTNSQVASILNSPSCNNAFLNGTGWSPSLNSISHSNTPQKNCKDEFRTPHKTVGPMTPLTTNQLQTPVKIATEQCAKVTLTPKARSYRPAVSPAHQEKILAIRSEMAAIGIATGRSRADRNGFSGIEGIEMKEAIGKLREFDTKTIEAKNNKSEGESGNDKKKIVFGHNSLIINVKVRLLKEQSNGIRSVLNLPHPELLNRRPSILVFASGDQARQALTSGANIVGGEELISSLIEGTLPEFNRCLATTVMLPTVMKVARILGPKGMMPNVKTGTLVDGKDIGAAVKNCLQSVPFKIEKNAGLLNMSLGTLNGSDDKLIENVNAVLDHLKRLAPNQNRYIERVYLSTRGYPGIEIKL